MIKFQSIILLWLFVVQNLAAQEDDTPINNQTDNSQAEAGSTGTQRQSREQQQDIKRRLENLTDDERAAMRERREMAQQGRGRPGKRNRPGNRPAPSEAAKPPEDDSTE